MVVRYFATVAGGKVAGTGFYNHTRASAAPCTAPEVALPKLHCRAGHGLAPKSARLAKLPPTPPRRPVAASTVVFENLYRLLSRCPIDGGLLYRRIELFAGHQDGCLDRRGATG